MEESLTAVERLCYVGSREIGALEYVPQIGRDIPDQAIDFDELTKLADEILADIQGFKVRANGQTMEQLIKIVHLQVGQEQRSPSHGTERREISVQDRLKSARDTLIGS